MCHDHGLGDNQLTSDFLCLCFHFPRALDRSRCHYLMSTHTNVSWVQQVKTGYMGAISISQIENKTAWSSMPCVLQAATSNINANVPPKHTIWLKSSRNTWAASPPIVGKTPSSALHARLNLPTPYATHHQQYQLHTHWMMMGELKSHTPFCLRLIFWCCSAYLSILDLETSKQKQPKTKSLGPVDPDSATLASSVTSVS